MNASTQQASAASADPTTLVGDVEEVDGEDGGVLAPVNVIVENALQKMRQPAEVPKIDGVGQLVRLLTGEHKLELETVKAVIQLYREERAEVAREAFNDAMSCLREVMPAVSKDRLVHYPARKEGAEPTTYRHTSLGYGMATVNPLLGRVGLSATWRVRIDEGIIYVKAIVTHRLNHSEEMELPGTAEKMGNMNDIQGIKSTITYLQRITMFSLLGIASVDDDDGVGAGDVISTVRPGGADGGDETRAQMGAIAALLQTCEMFDAGSRERAVAHYRNQYPAAENELGFSVTGKEAERVLDHVQRKLKGYAEKAAKNAEGTKAGDAGEAITAAP